MRFVMVLVALSVAAPSLTACTMANTKSRTYQTMTNTPNQCGTGFKRDREAC
ncbi:hypothetical protein GGR25_002264 [Kaistia hirudinis]|uniref:Lipoprotein n=1 Tax=Kaistia hirudinis TaxID=1293440 RepID=A0A840APB9_9HYPH|nr:hypothetical protein [Kaistia hirudinis]